ncbi:MAG: hypothetical protein M0Z30_08680 [Actinomycetota bacterium]|nr:hypothetical protein [Actinomycetota bacterium]
MFELAQGAEGSGAGHSEPALHDSSREDWLGEGEVDELIGDAAGVDSDCPPVLVLEVGELLGACYGVRCLVGDAVEEEPKPAVEIATLADALQGVVVLLTASLEVGRQVEQRFGQTVTDQQQEHDQETTKASVAVEEGVDRFELVVNQRSLHERRKAWFLVNEAFEVVEERPHLVWWRRYEGRGFDCGSWGSDPVLSGADGARLAFTATDAGEDYRVHLSDQTGAEREGFEAFEAPFHRHDVVDDLLDVRAGRLLAGLGVEDVEEGRLCALDPGGGDCFSPQVGLDEEVRLRQEAAGTGEASERSFGVGQKEDGLPGQHQLARDRLREVGDVAVTSRDAPSGPEYGVGVAIWIH